MTADEAREISDPIRQGLMEKVRAQWLELCYDTIREAAQQGQNSVSFDGREFIKHGGIEHFHKRGFTVKPHEVLVVRADEDNKPVVSQTDYKVEW